MSMDTLKAHLVLPDELSAMVHGSSTSWSTAPNLQDAFHVNLDLQLQHQYKMLADVFWEVRHASCTVQDQITMCNLCQKRTEEKTFCCALISVLVKYLETLKTNWTF